VRSLARENPRLQGVIDATDYNATTAGPTNTCCGSGGLLIKCHLRLRKLGWQDGYAAFTVSESQVARLRRYIRTQEEHHRKADFREELTALLDRHQIQYDERHLWD